MGEDGGPFKCCAFCVVAVSIGLIAGSCHSVDQGNLGLRLNAYEQVVQLGDDGKPYKPGNYFTGLGHRFIEYPVKPRELSFASNVRSREGMKIELAIKIRYLVNTNNLLRLYRELGELEEAEDLYMRVAQSAIETESVFIDGLLFLRNRTIVKSKLSLAVKLAYANWEEDVPKDERMMPNIVNKGFYLENVKVPPEFDQAVSTTTGMLQQVNVIKAENRRKKVQFETELLQAQQQVPLALNRASAKANELVQAAESQARGLVRQAQSEAEAKVLDTRSAVAALLVDAESVGKAVMIEAQAAAEERRRSGEAQATSTTVSSTAWAKQRNLTQYLQAKSYIGVFTALRKKEQSFLRYLRTRSLENVSRAGGAAYSFGTFDKTATPFEMAEL